MLTIGGNAKVTAVGGIIVNMQNEFGNAAFIVKDAADVNIIAESISEGEISGISMTNGYLMISENADVKVSTGDGKYVSFGIILGSDSESAGSNAGENDGKLIMSGGTLSVICSTARNSRAIAAQSDIEISGGTISAQSGTATEEASTGIYSKGAISISGPSDVTAISGTGPSLSAAVYADGGIVIDPSLTVINPDSGGLSADGTYISISSKENGGYATDVRIAAAPVTAATSNETVAPQETQNAVSETQDTEYSAPEDSSGSPSWIVWLIVTAACVICFGVIVALIKNKKK